MTRRTTFPRVPPQPRALNIRLATAEDAGPISTLLIANSAANGGTLYGDWSEAMISKWLATGTPIVVAQNSGGIKGVLFSAENAADAAPPVQAMFALALKKVIAPYAYGPICVDTSLRGQGVPAKLYKLLKREMGTRRGILFINRNNPGSLRAHAKLGMPIVGKFHLGDQTFDVLATPAKRSR